MKPDYITTICPPNVGNVGQGERIGKYNPQNIQGKNMLVITVTTI